MAQLCIVIVKLHQLAAILKSIKSNLHLALDPSTLITQPFLMTLCISLPGNVCYEKFTKEFFVTDVTHAMSFHRSQNSYKGYIGCWNRDQPEPACANFDFTNTWGPICCENYRVDFCCLPEPPCQVKGAIQEFLYFCLVHLIIR